MVEGGGCGGVRGRVPCDGEGACMAEIGRGQGELQKNKSFRTRLIRVIFVKR